MTSDRSAAERLRRVLLEEIDSGALPAGSRLGGERELAALYGVSRGTLRAVLSTLEEAGLVRRVPGRGGGTFISRPKVARDLGGIESVPGFLASQGYRAGSRVICTQTTTPPDRVRTALRLEEGALIYAIQRLRLADGRPISIDQAYFPAVRFAGLLDHSLGGSVYELLKTEYDTEPCEAEERIEVAHATDEEAALLSIAADAPLILVRRVTYDAGGQPFEYSKDLFRADRTSIRMRTPGRGIRRQILGDGGIELWGGEEPKVG